MQFEHSWEAVLSGEKTLTQELVLPEDTGTMRDDGTYSDVQRNGRTEYAVGSDYPVLNGSQSAPMGHIKILKIERQHIQEITRQQAIALGIWSEDERLQGDYRQEFMERWNRSHPTPGSRYEDNPEVWVLHFTPVES